MNIHDYLTEDCILFLDAANKHSAIEAMVQTAAAMGKLTDRHAFEKAVKSRESIMSTGIGLGIAVPHAKLHGISEFFIIIGILSKGIEWDSIDQKPVRAVFLIGGPEDQQTNYLQILSKLVLMAKNANRRDSLLESRTPKQVVELFSNI